MKPIFHKNFKLWKPNTHYACRKCKIPYPVRGDTYLYTKVSTPAVDGTQAYRVYWMGHCGHMRMRGYTKPVDFNKNLGTPETLESLKTFEEEEQEEQALFQELQQHAMNKSQNRRRIY